MVFRRYYCLCFGELHVPRDGETFVMLDYTCKVGRMTTNTQTGVSDKM